MAKETGMVHEHDWQYAGSGFIKREGRGTVRELKFVCICGATRYVDEKHE